MPRAKDELKSLDETEVEGTLKTMDHDYKPNPAPGRVTVVLPHRVEPELTTVFDRAALIRATHNFRLGDPLHLPAALVGG